jgi:hypothetical protein
MAMPPAGTSSPKLVGVGLPLVLDGPLLLLPVGVPLPLDLSVVLLSSVLVAVGLSVVEDASFSFAVSVVFASELGSGSADSEVGRMVS